MKGDDLIPDPKKQYALFATYDGEPGIYPKHAAQSIKIKAPARGAAEASTSLWASGGN